MQKQMMSARNVTIAVITAAALSLPMISAAQAQGAGKRHHPGTTYQDFYRPMYDPNAQGGTTGGTVNPAVNGDHQSHGYNVG